MTESKAIAGKERGMTRVGWNPTHSMCVWGGWAGLDCCSGAGVTRCLTNTAALTGPTAARTLLLYWLIPLSVFMCRHTCVHVCFSDFHWLCVHRMALLCVCVMGEVSTLPENPEADWVYLSRNGRNLPSKLQLPAAWQQHTVVQSQSADGAVNTQSHIFKTFRILHDEPKTRNVSSCLSWRHTCLNKTFYFTNSLNKIHTIFPTDWRDAPECVWLHPRRRPSGVQTPAPLGHVSSTAAGDVSTPGQPACCRNWWV